MIEKLDLAKEQTVNGKRCYGVVPLQAIEDKINEIIDFINKGDSNE